MNLPFQIFGICVHRALTFPQTPRGSSPGTPAYCVCLECGREFYYTVGVGRGAEIKRQILEPRESEAR